MATSPRAFAALSGTELKKAITTQFERQLGADTRFSQHLAYASVAWRWVVAIDVYPKEIGDMRIEGEGQLTVPGSRPIEPGEEPIQINLRGGETVAAPIAGVSADQVRRDAGLGVPQARVVKGPENSRITVDAPEVPFPKRESTEEGDTGASVVTDKPGPKGTIAKSVSLLTRANPKGAKPIERVGSAPTEADADKIIEEGLKDGTLEERSE